MQTQSEFEALAYTKPADAEPLLYDNRFDRAYYLISCGIVVERKDL